MGTKQFKQKLTAFAGSMGLVLATGTAYAIGPIEVGGWELKRISGEMRLLHDW